MKKIDCFIPFAGKEQAEKTVQGLQATGCLLYTSPSPRDA